jgi:hypothetical protein
MLILTPETDVYVTSQIRENSDDHFSYARLKNKYCSVTDARRERDVRM